MNRTSTWLTVTATCFLSFFTNKLLLADDAQPTGAWVFKELKVIRQESPSTVRRTSTIVFS